MKKLNLVACLLLAVLFACNKDNGSKEANVIINGIHDVSLQLTDSTIIPLQITQASEKSQENIALSVEQLPKGVTASFEPKSGVPTFSTMMKIYVGKGAPGGSHELKIVATNTSGSRKVYNMTLEIDAIDAVSGCNTAMEGRYIVSEIDNGVTRDPYEAVIYARSGTEDIIFENKYSSVMKLDCKNKTVLIERQTMISNPDSEISGSGTFTDSTITVDCVYKPSLSQPERTMKRVFRLKSAE